MRACLPGHFVHLPQLFLEAVEIVPAEFIHSTHWPLDLKMKLLQGVVTQKWPIGCVSWDPPHGDLEDGQCIAETECHHNCHNPWPMEKVPFGHASDFSSTLQRPLWRFWVLNH